MVQRTVASSPSFRYWFSPTRKARGLQTGKASLPSFCRSFLTFLFVFLSFVAHIEFCVCEDYALAVDLEIFTISDQSKVHDSLKAFIFRRHCALTGPILDIPFMQFFCGLRVGIVF